MNRYLIRRLLTMIPVLLGLTVVVFILMHILPGDPVLFMFVETPYEPETYKALYAEFGLDKPLHIQYLKFLGNLLKGELGRSIIVRLPVSKLIAMSFPKTVVLAFTGILIAIIIGMPAGVIAAVKHQTKFDYLTMAGSLFGISMPSFWLGILLLLIFVLRLDMFPAYGSGSLKHLILPGFTIGITNAAVIARLTRSSVLETLRQDYVRTARAKGLTERIVIYKHALKNALIPVVTVIGMRIGHILGGSVIVETIFAWPGIGRLAWSAVSGRDLPVIQGVMLYLALIILFFNLIVDLLYTWLDPRIRFE